MYCPNYDDTVWKRIVGSNKIKMEIMSCPYMEDCTVKFKKVIDRCTKRYIRCIEYQVLRIKELNKVIKENKKFWESLESRIYNTIGTGASNVSTEYKFMYEKMNKIINLLKLLKYIFRFNLNQLTFDELSDVLGTINFEEGFETNEFLSVLWNKFMDYLEDTVSNYIKQGRILWIHIKPFYFFEKIRQLLQQIPESTNI